MHWLKFRLKGQSLASSFALILVCLTSDQILSLSHLSDFVTIFSTSTCMCLYITCNIHIPCTPICNIIYLYLVFTHILGAQTMHYQFIIMGYSSILAVPLYNNLNISVGGTSEHRTFLCSNIGKQVWSSNSSDKWWNSPWSHTSDSDRVNIL